MAFGQFYLFGKTRFDFLKGCGILKIHGVGYVSVKYVGKQEQKEILNKKATPANAKEVFLAENLDGRKAEYVERLKIQGDHVAKTCPCNNHLNTYQGEKPALNDRMVARHDAIFGQ